MSGLGLGINLATHLGMPGWVPVNVAGCALWLRSDRGIHLGTGVAQWDDQSGTGDPNKNVTQGIVSRQPALNATDAAYNNLPTLGFIAANGQQLISGTWTTPIAMPETIFIVGNFDGTATNQVLADGGAANQRLVCDVNPGTTRAGIYNGLFLSSGLGLSAAPQIVVGLFNGASSQVWSSTITPAVTGSAGTTSATRTGLTVGATSGGSAPLNGKIAEVIIYSGALAASDFAAVMNYLGTRYGITIGA